MKQEPNENVDCQEGAQTLLSTKMKGLQQRVLLSKTCNFDDQHRYKIENFPTIQPFRTLPINAQRVEFAPKKKSASPSRRGSKLKKKSKGKSIHSLSEIFKRKGMTLFEITKNNRQNRKPVYKEVKNIQVSQFSGQGVLILPNQKKFYGQWADGTLVGQVKITYSNGDIYIGQTYEYQKHGRGTYTFGNNKYVGQFSGNDFHGEGILYDKEGRILYDGLWRRNQKWDK